MSARSGFPPPVPLPVTDYELGLWDRERRAEIQDPEARAQDRLVRALAALREARMTAELQVHRIADLNANLRRYRDQAAHQNRLMTRLRDQLARAAEDSRPGRTTKP